MAKVVYTFGDDVSTDTIYPGRYMATVLPSETPRYCFADYEDLNKKLNSGEIPKDSLVFGGKNFGCGSSREQAASTLKGHELTIIANDFARIFLQNAVNLGLKTVACSNPEAEVGDEIEITDTEVINITKNKKFEIKPLSETQSEVVDAGGLIAYARKKLLERAE